MVFSRNTILFEPLLQKLHVAVVYGVQVRSFEHVLTVQFPTSSDWEFVLPPTERSSGIFYSISINFNEYIYFHRAK